MLLQFSLVRQNYELSSTSLLTVCNGQRSIASASWGYIAVTTVLFLLCDLAASLNASLHHCFTASLRYMYLGCFANPDWDTTHYYYYLFGSTKPQGYYTNNNMSLVIEIFVCGLVGLVLFLNLLFFLWEKFRNKKVTRRPAESIVVITGCDTGFGEMTSRKLTKMGYKVISACLTDEGVKNLKSVVSACVRVCMKEWVHVFVRIYMYWDSDFR